MAQLKKEIEEFASRVQGLIDEHYEERFPNLTAPLVLVKFGRKYAKLIKKGSDKKGGQQSVYGFVDAHTGDIYKAATWAAPAKHIRGSIFDGDGGMSSCTPYGIVYLR
jgi:RNA processing factor Prp31